MCRNNESRDKARGSSFDTHLSNMHSKIALFYKDRDRDDNESLASDSLSTYDKERSKELKKIHVKVKVQI